MRRSLYFKPQVRMRSWEPPVPKPPARSRWWLWAILGWLAAVAVAHGIVYGWLWELDGTAKVAHQAPAPSRAPLTQVGSVPNQAPPSASVAQSSLEPSGISRPTPDIESIADCEAPSLESADDERYDQALPHDLSQSVWGPLLSTSGPLQGCRSNRSDRVHVCVATRRGEIVGLTVQSDRGDSRVERCVSLQLLRAPIPVAPDLRRMRAVVDLPRRRP